MILIKTEEWNLILSSLESNGYKESMEGRVWVHWSGVRRYRSRVILVLRNLECAHDLVCQPLSVTAPSVLLVGWSIPDSTLGD